MALLWVAFVTVLVAEIGDKSLLFTMLVASRHPLRKVLFALVLGIGALGLLAVLVGTGLSQLLSEDLILLLSGLGFLLFGLSCLRSEAHEQGLQRSVGGLSSLSLAGMLVLSELGDKTQFYTVALSAEHPLAMWEIFAGASLGLLCANLVGLFLGKVLGAHLPRALLLRLSFVLFCSFGLSALRRPLELWLGEGGALVLLWHVGGLLALALLFSFRKGGKKRLLPPAA